jgi:hypothetical protein
MSIDRMFVHLRHISDEQVTFKRFKHQGRWKWNDSRIKGSCSENHVVSEIARMLYAGDTRQAQQLLLDGIMGK